MKNEKMQMLRTLDFNVTFFCGQPGGHTMYIYMCVCVYTHIYTFFYLVFMLLVKLD